jgi:hypothetical protein
MNRLRGAGEAIQERQNELLDCVALVAGGRHSGVLCVQLGEDRCDLAVLGREAQRFAALDDDLARGGFGGEQRHYLADEVR